MMKKTYILIFSLFWSMFAQAQLVVTTIEKTTSRSPESSLLEFYDKTDGNDKAKGIILPIVDTPTPITEQGTLLFDAQDDKVKLRKSSGWEDLTDKSTQDYSSPGLDDSGEGAVIADGSIPSYTSAPAVLKLDSTKRAMILPHVQDVTEDIHNPEPGTIAYDMKSKSLAIFNGDYWFFWN